MPRGSFFLHSSVAGHASQTSGSGAAPRRPSIISHGSPSKIVLTLILTSRNIRRQGPPRRVKLLEGVSPFPSRSSLATRPDPIDSRAHADLMDDRAKDPGDDEPH